MKNSVRNCSTVSLNVLGSLEVVACPTTEAGVVEVEAGVYRKYVWDRLTGGRAVFFTCKQTAFGNILTVIHEADCDRFGRVNETELTAAIHSTKYAKWGRKFNRPVRV